MVSSSGVAVRSGRRGGQDGFAALLGSGFLVRVIYRFPHVRDQHVVPSRTTCWSIRAQGATPRNAPSRDQTLDEGRQVMFTIPLGLSSVYCFPVAEPLQAPFGGVEHAVLLLAYEEQLARRGVDDG